MTIKAQLIPINFGKEEEINIFIHGYSAVRSENELEQLRSMILSARPRGKAYLLYWKSGAWNNPPWVFTLKQGAKWAWRGGKAFNPPVMAAEMAAEFLITTIVSFKMMEKRAEELGKYLKKHISKIHGAFDYPINLIGHSLGARVVHYALAHNEWRDYHLKDCVLLGSAADAEDEDWPECADKISGKIYNAWSSNDKILMSAPDFRKRAGRHGILWVDKSIQNKAFPSFGHTDYWPNLEYILEKGWSNYKPNKNIIIIKRDEVYCPHCEGENIIDSSSQEWVCAYCKNDFIYKMAG